MRNALILFGIVCFSSVAVVPPLLGCGGGAFLSLAQDEQHAFIECRAALRREHHDDLLFLDYDSYARAGSSSRRRAWLGATGCFVRPDAAPSAPPVAVEPPLRPADYSAGGYVHEVDEFNGRERFIVRAFIRPEASATHSEMHDTGGVATFLMLGGSMRGGAALLMTFSFQGWQYLDCHSVDILADGIPVETLAATHDGQVGYAGSVTETVGTGLTRSSLMLMSAATENRVRICNTVYRLDASTAHDLGRLLDASEPAPSEAFVPDASDDSSDTDQVH